MPPKCDYADGWYIEDLALIWEATLFEELIRQSSGWVNLRWFAWQRIVKRIVKNFSACACLSKVHACLSMHDGFGARGFV